MPQIHFKAIGKKILLNTYNQTKLCVIRDDPLIHHGDIVHTAQGRWKIGAHPGGKTCDSPGTVTAIRNIHGQKTSGTLQDMVLKQMCF